MKLPPAAPTDPADLKPKAGAGAVALDLDPTGKDSREARTPMAFLGYQQRWAADTNPVKVCEKSRRIGLSWGEAGDSALLAAQTSGMDVWYIGYTKDMAEEFIRDCGDWLKYFGMAAGEIEEGEEVFIDGDEKKSILTFTIRCASGHRITALSSSPRNLRGKQGRVIIDEAAFHTNLGELLKAAMALLIWGGQVHVISTHDGDANPFNELVQDIRAGKFPYSLHTITFQDALVDGLYERVCLRRGIVPTDADKQIWVAGIYAQYGSNAAEELDCIPKNGSGAWLTRALIEARMSKDLAVLRWSPPAEDFVHWPEHLRTAEMREWLDAKVLPLLLALDPEAPSFIGEDFGRTGVLSPKIGTPTPDSANALAAPSPTYNLQAQGNYARLGQAIPVIYGRCKTFPDFGAQPWGEYSGNDQYLYQLLVIGQGSYEVEAVRIEDQVLTATLGDDGIWRSDSPFEDISWQIVPPGGTVTYFPVRVLVSDAVAGQDLGSSTSVGPIKITDAEINQIGIDLAAPRGLYYARDDGGLDARGFDVDVYATRLKQSGAAWVADGNEVKLGTISHSAATTTPQRISQRFPVGTGRYQVRIVRASAKDDSTRAGSDLAWVGLRGFVPGVQRYGNVTLLAMRAKATSQLSATSSRKINVIVTRKLPTWSPAGGWTTEQPTRSIAWALADILRNDQYGLGQSDDTLPLSELYRLETQVWKSSTAAGDTFDYSYDRVVNGWEAIGYPARAGRGLCFRRGPDIVFVRDEYRAVPIALFNMRNIVRGSFKLSFAMTTEDTPDSVKVTYWDEQIWAESSFVCTPPGYTANNPQEVTLAGVQRREQAARIGHYMARAARKRRIYGTFRTELEGRIVKPGDIIAVSHDLPEWGLSAELIGFTGTGKAAGDVLSLSEPCTFEAGQQHYILLTRRNGAASGPWRVTAGTIENDVVLAEPVADDSFTPYVGTQAERTRVSFGPGERYAARCLVLLPMRLKGREIEVSIVEDDAEVYDETGAVPPSGDDTWAPELVAKPVVRALYVAMVGNSTNPALELSWGTSGNPSYFLVDISTDGQSYSRVAEPTSPGCRISVPLGAVWVRVAAVGSIRGDWTTWSGNTATMMTIPGNVSGLVLQYPAPGSATQFTDPDCAITWTSALRADAYRIEVWANGVKLSEHQRSEPSFSYTMAQNRADGGPRRAIEFRVWGLNGAGESEAAAVLAVSNPQMPATVVQGTQTSEQALLLTVPLQTAADYAGTIFVVSQDGNANPATLAIAADVPSWSATVPVSATGVWYYWAANYDGFGKTQLNWSPRGQVVVVEAAGGVPTVDDASKVTAPPGSPPPGGKAFWAVYDVVTGKMWRWDSATGRYTAAVSAGDIADKIQQAQISADVKWAANQILVEPGNLVADAGFNSPAWWAWMDHQTDWPAHVTINDGGQNDGQPKRFMKIDAGANFDWTSRQFSAVCNTSYRLRIRVFRSADFVGKAFCGFHVPWVAWACPGADVPSISPEWNMPGFTTPHPQWTTYEGIWTTNERQSYMQARIRAEVTAGSFQCYLECVPAVGASMIVDGAVVSRTIASGAVSTEHLQAKAVTADKISVASLSAISASLGTLTSSIIEMTNGTGWQYIRTGSKWLGDSVNGWICAARPENGSFFQEFRAGSGNALIQERKGGGPDLGGPNYYLYVRDANGVERLIVDPLHSFLKMRGRIEADDGYFSGTLNAATGSFSGTLTARAVNAISRINIAGEQIVIARSVDGTAITYAPSSLADGESINCLITAGFSIKGRSLSATTYAPGGQAGGGVAVNSLASGGVCGTARIYINNAVIREKHYFVLGASLLPVTLIAAVSIRKGDVVRIGFDGEAFQQAGYKPSLSELNVPASDSYLESGWIVIQGGAR